MPDLLQGLFALSQGHQGGPLLISCSPQLRYPLAQFGGLPGSPGGGYPSQFWGQFWQSPQSLWGGSPFPWSGSPFPCPRRLPVGGRASWFPVGVTSPVLYPPGFPVAALQLGTPGLSWSPPSLPSSISGGPFAFLPRVFLSMQRGASPAAWASASGSPSHGWARPRSCRLSGHSRLRLQLALSRSPLSHRQVLSPVRGAVSSTGASLCRR